MAALLPLWLMLGQLAKDELVDKPQRKQQNLLRANTQKLAPFLRDPTAQKFAQSNLGNNLLQSAFTGLALQQNLKNSASQNKTREQMLQIFKQQQEPGQLRALDQAAGGTGNVVGSELDSLLPGVFDTDQVQGLSRPGSPNFANPRQGQSVFDILATSNIA